MMLPPPHPPSRHLGGPGMMRGLRIYRRCLGAHFRAVLEYQADFWLLLAAGVVSQALGLVFLSAIFAKVPTLNGWRFEETVLIYGLAGLTQAAVPLLADGIWLLGAQIHNGDLDYRLVRPYPTVLQLMSAQIGFSGFGDAITATVLTSWALTRVDVNWSISTVAIGLVLLASATLIRIAIIVAANTVSFWMRAPLPLFASAVFHVGELARYPLNVYGFSLRVLLTALIPFAFTGFFPAAWLLNRDGYAWLGLATPLVAVAACTSAYILFQRGLRRYESAGH